MNSSKQSYVHRGDRERRWSRIRKIVLVVALIGAAALVPRERPKEAHASVATFSFGSEESQQLRTQLDATRGQLALVKAQLARAKRIMMYSGHYKVDAKLAASIYDIALAEGIDPDLGFRLVRVESRFHERAISPVGAVGLTQLMPATARYFRKGVTREQLYDRETNLRIGFRYLRALIDQYEGDMKLALLAYNRGPVTVANLRARGIDPGNGYAKLVTKGYTGTGVID